MKSVVRYVVLLVASVAVFLIIIGALLVWRQSSLEQFRALNERFFSPSYQHLVHALGDLDRISADIYRQGRFANQSAGVPHRFQVEAAVSHVERHLAELIRLCQRFDYEGAFDLPSRSHRQFNVARRKLSSVDTVTEENIEGLLNTIRALRNTLTQMERLFALDQLASGREEQKAVVRSSRLLLLTTVLLLLVASPLIVRLSLGLRNSVRHEIRIRHDLEEAKKSLEQMALYDNLTELGNRYLFKAQLEQAVGMAKRSGRFSALLYLDLDHFKRVNDTMGHDAGDQVLKVIGARLHEGLRAGDTAARVGGDEFTVIVCEMARGEDAGIIAKKLLHRIAEPITIHGRELTISASAGITIIPTDSDEPTALMKNADLALYKAKDAGRQDFQFFVEEMNREIIHQTTVELELRSAIRGDQFALHYQPQVALGTGRVLCVEALLRWTKPDGTVIPPDLFIPVAEKSGLLTDIGDWVLRTACRDAALLHEQGSRDLRVSVNLSPRQFRDRRLISRIEKACLANGLKPEFLEIEITETTLIDNIHETIDTLNTLRNLGVTVVIDDFGIGYSSLNYLKQLPIDALKIDRSFVRDIENDEVDRSIVDAILAMARTLSLRVIAEGVETEWQLNHLSTRQCDIGQGYLFSKPLPLEQISISTISESSARLTRTRDRGLRLIDSVEFERAEDTRHRIAPTD